MLENKKEISWTAPQFVHYHKGLGWFISLGIVSTVLILYYAFKKDFLTAALFLLFAIVIYYFAKAKPRQVHIKIDDKGLKINENRIPYQNLKAFWIHYDPPQVKTLNFETTAYLNRSVSLLLMDQNPLAIKDYLLQFLPEELERKESFGEKVARKLKF